MCVCVCAFYDVLNSEVLRPLLRIIVGATKHFVTVKVKRINDRLTFLLSSDKDGISEPLFIQQFSPFCALCMKNGTSLQTRATSMGTRFDPLQSFEFNLSTDEIPMNIFILVYRIQNLLKNTF